MEGTLLKFPRNRWSIALAIVAGLLSLGIVGLWTVVQTDWFKSEVRRRIIRGLEQTTGGQVEMGELSFSLLNLRFDIQELTLRGAEKASHPPLIFVPAVRLQVGLETLFRGRLALRSLELDKPQTHIEVAEDGLSNIPRPLRSPSGAYPAPELFDIIVRSFEINQGSLRWNGSHYDISVSTKDLDVRTSYESSLGRYNVRVRVGDSFATLGNLQPLISEGAAEVLLYRERIEVPEIYLAVGESRLYADGRFDGWIRPNAHFAYSAEIALPSLAAWFSRRDLNEGVAEIAGQVRWQGATEKLEYSGDVALTGTSIQNELISISKISGFGKFIGDEKRFSILPLELSALGGVFSGSLLVEGLNSGSGPQISFQCEVEDLQLESMLAGLNPEQWPTRAVPWSSVLEASVSLEGSVDSIHGDLSVGFAAPESTPAGRVPVEGFLDLQYSGREQSAQITRLELVTPETRLNATGIIAADDSSLLRLSATTRGPEGLQTVTRFSGVQLPGKRAKEIPFELNGSATIEGDLTGNWFAEGASWLGFEGQLEAVGIKLFDYDLDHIEGHLRYSPGELRVSRMRMRHEGGSATVALVIPLSDGQPALDRLLSAEVEVQDLQAEQLLGAAGQEIPVTGTLDGRLTFEGSTSVPRGTAQFDLRNGHAWDAPFDQLSGVVHFGDGKLSITSLELTRDEALIQAAGDYELSPNRFELNLKSRNWPLENLPRASSDFGRLRGNVEFDLAGSGRLSKDRQLFERLHLAGDWSVEKLFFNEKEIGKLSGEVETIDDQVALQWRGDLLSGRWEGSTTLHPGGPLRGETKFTKVSTVQLAGLAGLPSQEIEGEVDGEGSFSSEALNFGDFKAEGTITRFEAGLPEIPGADRGFQIWNPFPMRWSFADRSLRLDRMRLLGDGTDFEIDGTIGLGDARRMNVTVEGTVNLAVLRSFRPGLTTEGSSTVQITIAGGLDDPSVDGELRIRDGVLRSEDFPNGLNQMNGLVTFTGRNLHIEEVTATTGGGTVRLTGNVQFAGGEEVDYRLRAEAANIRVRTPEAVSSVLNGQLTLSGTDLASLLSGKVTIRRITVSPDINVGAMIAALGEPTRTPPRDPVLSNMQLNIQVASVPGLRVETSLIRDMETRIDMRVTGTAVQPSLLGEVSVTQGQVTFQGSRYTINRGDIDFVNPFRLEPVVNFELETRIRDVDVALFLSGPARKMNLSFRSDPPLQFNELVSLIAVGRAPSQDPVFAAQQTIEQQHLIQAGASTVLANALSQPVSGRLQRFFGVSRLRVDPQIGGAEADPGARISTEQQITSDLTLIYSYDLSSAQQQVVRVEWAPNRRWSLILTRDENGLVGGDLLYKKRLR